nr:LysM peptidoglycan-binding domain-containing protein [Cohnella sp. CFH 77786]
MRFDIYERVHLPDDVAAIEELEEVELVPHMQAKTHKDHVLLKGHLLLSGFYRAKEQTRGVTKLEHWIPVEISLPPNRVSRVEDLAVEIDNFDVDLLSTRSLNVTGVLALRGLAEQQQEPVWRDDSFTVVHQAPAEAGLAGTPAQAEPENPPSETTQEVPAPAPGAPVFGSPDDWRKGQEGPGDGPAVEFGTPPPFEQVPPVHLAVPPQTMPYYAVPEGRDNGVWPFAPFAKPEPEAETVQIESGPGSPEADWKSDVGWGDVSSRKTELDFALPEYPAPWNGKVEIAQDPAGEYKTEPWAEAEDRREHKEAKPEFGAAVIPELGTVEKPEYWAAVDPEFGTGDKPEFKPEFKPEEKPAFKPEEKQELKVAYGAKPWESPVRAPSGVGLLSVLGDKGAAREAELQALRAAQAEANDANAKLSRESTGDELEWTKLFLGKGSEAQQFSKVRMCIVQREDTLDSIAARYNVQVRELQLRNRLIDPYLSEGQVLYIP